MVYELEVFWGKGYCFKSSQSPMFGQLYRTALISVACDIPATRKVCGFLCHAARLGCNKCKREFQSKQQGHNDLYLLAEFGAGEPRTDDGHLEQGRMVKLAKTKHDREAIERDTGVRYTELLRLPYYLPIRFVTIDPMHNLFLGTAKHIFKILWIEEECDSPILSKAHLHVIQARVDSVKSPSHIEDSH